MSTFGHDEPDLCGCGQKVGHVASCLATRQAGPLMVRHIIDGHEVLLPSDAKLRPRLKPAGEIDPDEPLGGLY